MDLFARARESGGGDPQDLLNGTFYRSPRVLRHLPTVGLDDQEIVTLLKYHEHILGRDVLDVGVGRGRTARVLAPLARSYVAFDYSPIAVAEAQRAMPGREIHLADMRDLHRWGDGTIDFVFAPCNVIDAVSHADRLRTLGEAWRVLRTDGLLAFSSHNRAYAGAHEGPRLELSRNPVTAALRIIQHVRNLLFHRRMRRLHRFEDDYALLDDSGGDHALLHYYVDRFAEERQLDAAGFELLEVLDRDGATVAPGEAAARSSCLMYVARKRRRR
jgi:SAM-dependent methyltransferase